MTSSLNPYKPQQGPLKMSVLPPSCRRPCRLSRLLVGGLAVATERPRAKSRLGQSLRTCPVTVTRLA